MANEYQPVDRAKQFITFLKFNGVFLLPKLEAAAIETLVSFLMEAYHAGAAAGLTEAQQALSSIVKK